MGRIKRLELNKVAPCFKGYKNIINWYVDFQGILWIETKHRLYSAKKFFGTYGFITRHE